MAGKNFNAKITIGGSLGSSVGSMFSSLKNKIKDQEKTLGGLRKAYKEAEKGTGEWAGKLDELKKHIEGAENKLKSLQRVAKVDLGKSLGNIGNSFGKDMRRLGLGLGIVTGLAATAGAAIMENTRSFVDWADDIGDTAEALNMSSQALTTWIYAAGTVGVGQEKLTAGFAKFHKTLSSAGDGKKGDVVFNQLGLNIGRLKKLKPDDQLNAIAEGFKNYKGKGDKAVMATTLFGKAGWKMNAMLSKGAVGMKEFAKMAKDAGVALDDETASAAGEAADSMDIFGLSMRGLKNNLAIGFVPTLSLVADKLGTFVRGHGKEIREGTIKFGKYLTDTLLPKLGELADRLPGIAKDVGRVAKKFWNGLTAVKDFVGGWDKLGAILLVANFAPTIVAIGQMAVAMGSLAVATWGAVGPVGLAVIGFGALYFGIMAIVDPGGPLDLLGKMFPETMNKINNQVKVVMDNIDDRLDKIIAKVSNLLGRVQDPKTGKDSWMPGRVTGFDPNNPPAWKPSKFDRQFGPRGATPVQTSPDSKKPQKRLQLPDYKIMPAPGSGGINELKEYLKSLPPQTSQNTFHINVSAGPGADGAEIGRQLRREFQRKPLFDYDGTAVPA